MASDATVQATPDDDATFHLVAGEARVEITGSVDRVYRGQVIALVKPDGTVLVHDVSGYKPIAWITRAESVRSDSNAGVLTAVDGNKWLRVEIERGHVDERIPGSAAGEPVGTCPRCEGRLVLAGETVHCIGCRDEFTLPSGASMLSESCTCGLPLMRVERGEPFDLCIDRSCDPMEEAIADRFDREWDCPESGCEGQLRIFRRGHLMAGCDQYPECETAFTFPAGRLDGYCGCGLPRFHADGHLQCLDATCETAD